MNEELPVKAGSEMPETAPVAADALLVEVAARLSSAQISVVVVCDAVAAALGVITETALVRRLSLGVRSHFLSIESPGSGRRSPSWHLSSDTH